MSAIPVPSLWHPTRGIWTPRANPRARRRRFASMFTELFSTEGKGKSVDGKGVDSPVGKGREDSATNQKCCCDNCPREYNVKPITGVTVLTGGRVRVTCPGHGINAPYPRVNYPSTQDINFVPAASVFIFGCSLERVNTFLSSAAVVDANTFDCSVTINPWPPLGPIAPPYGFLDRSVSGLIGTWPARSVRGHPWWMRLSFNGITFNPYHVYPSGDEEPYCWEEISISGAVPEVTDLEVPWTTTFYYSWTDTGTPGGYGSCQYQEWSKAFTGPSCTRNGTYTSDQWTASLRIGIRNWTQFGMYGNPSTTTYTYSKTASLTSYAAGTVCWGGISQVFKTWPPPSDSLPTADDPEWGFSPSGSGPRFDARAYANYLASPDSGDPCYPNSGYGGFAAWKPCKADFQTRPNEMGW